MRIFFIIFIVLTQYSWANQKDFRPSKKVIKHAVSLVPAEYQKEVLTALRKAGRNAWELIDALEQVGTTEREGMAFLITNMPGRDLVALKSDFLIKNTQAAYQALEEVPWGHDIPKEIFLNNILPYASLNEHRDDWRDDFHQRFFRIALAQKNIDQAVLALNKYVYTSLKVSYSANLRPKPDQSPYESTQAHYASCTGLSILLIDALRSVGIPARIAAIEMWPDESGNHTWVEIWDGQWHYIGASESSSLDQAWFSQKASKTDSRHPIFASSFKKTQLNFPMRWAPGLRFVPAIDVTDKYIK